MAIQSTAEILFQTAYESRYTWDENFPGYTADVQLLQEGKFYTGQIQIDRNLNIEITGVADKQIEAGIDIQLQEIVARCQRGNFHSSYGEYEFTLGEAAETDVIKIFVKGKNIDSHYRICGKKIHQEVRLIGRMALEINSQEFLDTDFGYIPSVYDVIFRNSQTGDVNSILKFADTYQKFGDYYILTEQIVGEYEDRESKTAQSTTEFAYDNITLL